MEQQTKTAELFLLLPILRSKLRERFLNDQFGAEWQM